MGETVVHCKRAPYDVYIGRPSRWGNPFVIGRDGDRQAVIAKYREWVLTRSDLMADLPELWDKVLGCWCAPLPCHGDVLAQLALEALERRVLANLQVDIEELRMHAPTVLWDESEGHNG